LWDRPLKYIFMLASENDLHLESLPMFVCICKAVTDRQIREAAERGIDNVDALAESLGAGTGCGRCRENAEKIIEQHLGERLFHAA
jgi:bacterioferritin-associated ferredoxin